VDAPSEPGERRCARAAGWHVQAGDVIDVPLLDPSGEPIAGATMIERIPPSWSTKTISRRPSHWARLVAWWRHLRP
jgi:hypothetical protein